MGCFCLFCATIWPENVLYRPLFEPKHCQNREKKIILSRRARGNPNVIVGPLGGLYWPHNISSIWHSYQTLKMQKSQFENQKNPQMWVSASGHLPTGRNQIQLLQWKTDRGLVLVAKLAFFTCPTILLLGWRLKNKYFGLMRVSASDHLPTGWN